MDTSKPFHAHIYFRPQEHPLAGALRAELQKKMIEQTWPQLKYVGALREFKVGPHPLPQFEIHFTQDLLGPMTEFLKHSGLIVLVHPLTHDDLADHTTLATWLNGRLDLDLSVLDPVGHNQGVARFAKNDF